MRAAETHPNAHANHPGAVRLWLAGNCISCIGTLAGLGDPPPAIIWLDAHGDFNTPESRPDVGGAA